MDWTTRIRPLITNSDIERWKIWRNWNFALKRNWLMNLLKEVYQYDRDAWAGKYVNNFNKSFDTNGSMNPTVDVCCGREHTRGSFKAFSEDDRHDGSPSCLCLSAISVEALMAVFTNMGAEAYRWVKIKKNNIPALVSRSLSRSSYLKAAWWVKVSTTKSGKVIFQSTLCC
jgi:hypothetical protein